MSPALIIAGFYGIGAGVFAWLIWTAPEAYQDSSGFHFGPEPSEHSASNSPKGFAPIGAGEGNVIHEGELRRG